MKEKLTNQPQTPYPRSGGIFMDGGQNELLRGQEQTSPQKVFLKETLGIHDPRLVPPQDLKNKLTSFANGFEQRMIASGNKNPFEQWTDERLKQEYLGLNATVAKVEKELAGDGGEQRQELSDKMRDYNTLLLEQLERRGVDLNSLFLEAANVVEEEGNPFLSIGAASSNPGRGDRGGGRERGFGLYLQPSDIERLDDPRDRFAWLDEQFGLIYRSAKQGQELSSPTISNIQTVVSEAIRYLQAIEKGRPEEIERFNTIFTQRLNLMVARTSISQKNMEGIPGAMSRLQAHGLLTGLNFDGGNVRAMFYRMNEFLDDMRLAEGGDEFHLSPEMVSKLQTRTIDEQFEMAKRGVGNFASNYKGAYQKEYENITKEEEESELKFEERRNNAAQRKAEEFTRSEILRSVRTAYDVLVTTQREAVISSRGGHLSGLEAYFSDPSAVFNIFNLEHFTTGKFKLFSEEAQEFRDRMKLDLAEHHFRSKGKDISKISEEEKLRVGGLLLKELFTVADFFSSGWRIVGILDKMKEVFAYKKALYEELTNGKSEEEKKRISQMNVSEKDFLGLAEELTPERLVEIRKRKDYLISKKARDTHDKDREELDKMSDNFALFFRLKLAGKDNGRPMWKRIETYRPEEIIKIFRERGDNKEREEINREIFGGTSVADYDRFKDKYGGVLRYLRDNASRKPIPEQLDMANLSDEYKEIIAAQTGGSAEEVARIYTKMHAFIRGNNLIGKLLEDPRFEDVYARVLTIDDAFLDELEVVPKGSGIVPLSETWSSDIGGDALVRNINDIGSAIKAGSALISFIQEENPEERMKAAVEFANSVSNYNGLDNKAKAIRFTVGTLLKVSKKDYHWDVIDLDKLPFEMKISDIERIYGYHMKPMGRDELRAKLLELKHLMGKAVDFTEDERAMLRHIKAEEGELAEIKAREELRERKKHGTEDMVDDLAGQLEVKFGDIVKRKSLSFIFFFLLALLGGGIDITKKTLPKM